MKPLIACVLFAVVGRSLASCPDQPQQVTKGVTTESGLTLRARVVGQRYCHVDPEAFSVFMDVSLRFTNVTNQPVILSKNVEAGVVRVAKSIQAAKNGDFEVEPSPDYFPSKLPSAPRFGKVPDPKDFVVLASGASYELTMHSGVGVIGILNAAKATKGSGFLAQGSHVLQLVIETWPYHWPYFKATAEADELSERWSKYGHLAIGVVYSDLVPFTIPEKFSNPPCSGVRHGVQGKTRAYEVAAPCDVVLYTPVTLPPTGRTKDRLIEQTAIG